jgi:hypothetical protein
MGSSFTPQVKKFLTAQGCLFERSGKGDHEIWFSPITQRHFAVDGDIRSRHTAIAVSKAVRRPGLNSRASSSVSSQLVAQTVSCPRRTSARLDSAVRY